MLRHFARVLKAAGIPHVRFHDLRHSCATRDRLHVLGVRELALFGSHARGDARPDSDVDFLVEFGEKSFDRYMELKELLEDLLGRKVDLVLKSAIKTRLREHILSEAMRVA